MLFESLKINLSGSMCTGENFFNGYDSVINLFDSCKNGFICFNEIVVKKSANIFESRYDPELKIENEILRTTPRKYNREILNLINTYHRKNY